MEFIYDGECPFCNYFAQLLELKSNVKDLSFIDARDNLPQMTILLKQGYDINDGAILRIKDEILTGSEAINYICSIIEDPSDSLLSVLKLIFKSKKRSSLLFPFLIYSRRLLLLIKGKPLRPVRDEIQFF